MAIEYKTVTYRTVESANDNATYCWVELSASHVPAVNGLIKRIVIQGATTSASGMTTDPMYLGIWERQDDGGLISLGCSKNAVVQAINQQSVWDFDGAIIRGKSLLLGLLSSPDEHWTNNTQLLLRSRVQTNDTDGCVILTNIGRLKVTPDITFTVEYPEYVPDAEPEEPEPEQPQRVIDISKYWIPLIRETAEFQQIANALNPEFNRLIECQNRLLKDGFILEATEYGVQRWETILHLSVTEGMSLDERKEQILKRLSLKLPYTVRVLRQMLAAIVGDGNFSMSIDNDTQTLTLEFPNAATDITNVEQLLKRVLPMNLDIDMWVDGISTKYTLLEYLESSGTQYINTQYIPDTHTGLYTKYCHNSNQNTHSIGVKESGLSFIGIRLACGVGTNGWGWNGWMGWSQTHFISPGDVLEGWTNWLDTNGWVRVTSVPYSYSGRASWLGEVDYLRGTFTIPLYLFSVNNSGKRESSLSGKMYAASISQGKEVVREFIPILDEKGKPCMFDKITRQCFYNSGTGTFGYRVKTSASDIMQVDLDDPYYTAPSGVWAKLIAENTLDIIADTDLAEGTTQGYTWFANSGDAYQYFNIEEVNEND